MSKKLQEREDTPSQEEWLHLAQHPEMLQEVKPLRYPGATRSGSPPKDDPFADPQKRERIAKGLLAAKQGYAKGGKEGMRQAIKEHLEEGRRLKGK